MATKKTLRLRAIVPRFRFALGSDEKPITRANSERRLIRWQDRRGVVSERNYRGVKRKIRRTFG
jgi:hypothetical protein